MITSDHAQVSPASTVSSNVPIRTARATTLQNTELSAQPTRKGSFRNSHFLPRIPRPVSKKGGTNRVAIDPQFQGNASSVQRPLSLLVPNGSNQKGHGPVVAPYIPATNVLVEAASQLAHRGLIAARTTPLLSTPPKSRQNPARERRSPLKKKVLKYPAPAILPKSDNSLSPTDSDDEDPFHFDDELSASPTKKRDDTLKSQGLVPPLLRRASIVPVDPAAEPAPHRFSLLRERASSGTVFVQEICDADGRRWSLRVPASGMPDDMVSMLEELERLALELGQALPKIVVTCSMQSLSTRQDEMVDDDIKSPGLLHPWMELADDPEGQEEIHETPVAKEKSRLIEPEPELELEPGVQAGAPTVALQEVSTPSEQSLECIYLPKLAPEFLSGSSTSPVLQPAEGFHSKPAPATQTPRQRAFFSALKEPASTSSGIAKLLTPRSTDATSTPAASTMLKYHHGKSALPILKTRTGAMAPAASPRCNRTALQNNSPGKDTGVSPTKSSRVNAAQNMAACKPGSASLQQKRTQAASASIPCSELARTSTLPSRGIRHLFRRPPVRSASDPPMYSAPIAEATRVQRPVSEVISTLREVEPRRMPRLPSARDLLRKLT